MNILTGFSVDMNYTHNFKIALSSTYLLDEIQMDGSTLNLLNSTELPRLHCSMNMKVQIMKSEFKTLLSTPNLISEW